jgi:hypothetical protein
METLDPSLKKWIAENLIGGCTPDSLVPPLLALGVPQPLAEAEISAAQIHPYLHAAMDVSHAFKRRESLLRTLDHYLRMDPKYLSLTRKKLPPFKKFLTDYLYPNRPGLFRNAFDHWAAARWTPRALVEKVGAATIVEVQKDRESDRDYEMNSVLHKRSMPFGEFIDTIESKVTNDLYLTANNQALQNTGLSVLAKDMGNLGDGYLDPSQSAGRTFLWVGPKGIITPLHHDRTHNLFIQIYGRKRFRLIPAMQAPYMYNHRAVFSRVDLLDPKPEAFPLFAQSTIIDITVKAGDLLYIPAGWWHHVMGETTSISLSFTNISGTPNHFLDFPEG